MISLYDDPGLTLTYVTARSNWVKHVNCADTSPGCQVGVYVTIGPLLLLFVQFVSFSLCLCA